MKRPLLAVCFVLTGVFAIYCLLFPPPVRGHKEWDGREAAVCGTVDRKEYRTSYGTSQLLLYLSDISITDIFQSDKNNNIDSDRETFGILCYLASAEAEPRMGSRVCLRGRLEDFPAATNPGGFDSRVYYASMGMGMRMVKAEILWESETCGSIREALWRLRRLACRKLDDFLPPADASVMKAMLTGDKETLDGGLKERYRKGGIAHVLAVSGLHISLIGMGVYRLLRKIGLPVWPSALLCMALILMYGTLTGAGVSACRAGGMFLIRMLAEILGRTYDMQTATGVLLLFMALRQPLYLSQSGFLFSFSSLMGIGLLYPALCGKGRGGRRYRSGWRKGVEKAGERVRQALYASLSVTAATLPVQLWHFGEFSVYGVFLNLLALPLLAVLMYCGVLLIALPAGIWLKLPAFLIHAVLCVYESLCRGAEKLPCGTWIAGRPALWQVVLYLSVLAGIVLAGKKLPGKKLPGKRLPEKRLPEKRLLGKGLPGLLLGAMFMLLAFRAGGGFQVTFLDVGQGDCICIRTASGQNYLVDGGSGSEKDVGQYRILPFLKQQGIGYLDALFITHPDDDHCNGLEGLLAGGYGERIGRLILPGIAVESRKEAYLRLEQTAAQWGIPVAYLSAGIRWQDGETQFWCLHPPKGYAGTESNAYSQVLYVKSGPFSLLLTGDIEAEGERLLTEQMRAQGISGVTVLKTAHHGSASSTGDDFLRQAKPLIAVISCGKDNSYGHPHAETLERLRGIGARVYQTPDSGAVILQGDGDGIAVREYLSDG